MPYNQRDQAGTFSPTISDDDLWALYEQLGTTSKVARECGLAPRSVRERLAKIRTKNGRTVKEANIDVAGSMERLINAVPRELDGGGTLAEVDTSLWELGAKDQLTGEINKRGLDKIGARYRFATGNKALVVQPFESKVVAYRATGTKDSKTRRIFILGDCQLGFWEVRDSEKPKEPRYVPFHDERALDVTLQALALYRPDVLVIVGDFFDFPQLSRFQQEPEFQQTLQASIQYGHDLLGKIRKTVGDKCEIHFIPGNHETRMTRAICNNNPSLYKLTKPGSKWPVYSVPFLMDFEKRNISCAAEYPSGEVWLAKRQGNIPALVVTHADPKKKELRADAIHGHLVLPAIETRQVFYEDGPVTYLRMCVSGCGNYSDTSDKMRITRTNTPSGRARMSAVASFGTVSIDKTTGLRDYGLHIINDGRVQFAGKTITSKIKATA